MQLRPLKRYVLLTGVLMLCSISLFAQSERRKPEIFLGYSNLQAQGLPDKNNVTGIFESDFLNSRTTLHADGLHNRRQGTAWRQYLQQLDEQR